MWMLAMLACTTGELADIDLQIEISDADLVRALIDGQADADAVLDAVAWSDGWPVQDGDQWLFVYAGGAPDPSLAGDFNAWTPVAMNEGAGFHWVELTIAEPHGLKYKFVEGGEWISDPSSRSYTFDENGRVSYVAPPDDVFHLERWPDLDGGELESRDLRVYVPAGPGPWPVLYAHDGQNLFDPGAMWGGWRLQEALAGVGPMLVVGIDNTAARMDEYTHVADDIGDGQVRGGSGDAYAELVHGQIGPHIRASYATSDKSGLLGSSLGGLVSLHIAQRFPGEYDFVASLSGTLGWGSFGLDNETMQTRWQAEAPEIAVFVDSGGDAGANGCEDPDGDGSTADDPDATDNYCTTVGFAEALAAQGFAWEEDLWHWHEPGHPHNEAAWAERVFRPLERFDEL